MELVPEDAKKLRSMVQDEWFPHKERELEATFGVGGVVDSTRFLAVAQRLKSKGFKEVRQPDRLTISLEDNTRYTIEGEGTIAQYCQDNTLVNKSAVAMIKDRAGDLHTLDIKEYDTRIKIRRELPLDMKDPRVQSHYATWDQRVKFFRLIQRYTFVGGKGVIFDLSMVRSTKKDDRGLWKQVKRFYDEDLHHNIMKEAPSYEIEVELDHQSSDADTPEKALLCLIQAMGEVLRGIQRNPILIRNSVRDEVLKGYNDLVEASDDKPGNKGFRGVQPVTLEKENMSTQGLVKYGTLSIRHGYNVTDKADGLRVMAYCNEKGELFLIDMGMNVYRTGLKKIACANYLLDGEWVTRNKDNEPVQMLLLFDIYVSAKDNANSKIANQEFMNSEVSVNTRHKALVDWCAMWRSEGGPTTLVKGLTPQNSMKVMEKKFLMAGGTVNAPSTEIFTKCEQMLNRNVNYNTDGLIITSNKAPLPPRFGTRFPSQFKWKPSHDNTIDFLVKIVKDPQTSLDKLTDIIRPDSQDTIKYKTLRLYVGTSADPAYDDPRRTILMIKKLPSGRAGGRGKKKFRMRPVLFNPLSFEDTSANVCNIRAQEDIATRDWIIRCSTKDDAPGDATGDPITNNSIVEMRYDTNPAIPSGWNWIPLRVRYDKTERFQGGTVERTLNSVETANSVWTSIHDPITKHMITTGDDNPSKEEQEASVVAQQQKAVEVKRYYQKKSTIKNISLIKNMTMFHNLLIKGSILTDRILTFADNLVPARKTVIDTSVGKGGDIGRYYHKVEYLVGIDLDGDGIRDPEEGAYRRYMNELINSYKYSAHSIPTMVFMIGDSTKSYADGKSGVNEEEADMMRAVFGKVPPVAKVPPYVDAKCKGIIANGAHAMFSMFSIHYYFKSKETWEGFLLNIRDNLKVGGFFACCCFNGDVMAKRLSTIEKGNAIEGTDPISGASIWRITKQNDLGEVLPTSVEEGFGHAIDVEFLSIGSPHTEYLVSPTLLIEQLRTIGVELVSARDCAALGLALPAMSFKDTYASFQGATSYPMNDEVKEFSFFNSWYMFRRYGQVAVSQQGTPEFVVGDGKSPMFSPSSPIYQTGYQAPSPPFVVGDGKSPMFSPSSPVYQTGYQAPSPPFVVGDSKSPMFSPSSPVYQPEPTGYQPTSPVYQPEPTGYQPKSPVFSPTSPVYGSTLLQNRPKSPAWQNVPTSGSNEQAATLQNQVQELQMVLSPGPVYTDDMNYIDKIEVDQEWNRQERAIRQIARARFIEKEKNGILKNLSDEDREVELLTAEDMAVSKAMELYLQANPQSSEGKVTAVVEGGDRTVAVERATAAGPQKKFKPGEIFRFYGKAELKDSLGIQDPGAARWLALSAPFPIKDGGTEYPTVNHYLAAMKYKVATDKPELADDLFSNKGTIHTKYLRQREAIAVKHKGDKEKGQVKEFEDQELLRAEAADVANAALPKTIKRYKASFDEAKWIAQKDEFLKEALSQRWKYDARFRKVVEAARLKGKYLLYYVGSSSITSFGGVRRDDGRIEGENQVGKIIMDLAGYPPL